MIIKKLLIILLLLTSSLFSTENKKITLYLDWLNQFQFAGYYIAKEKGFYSNYGLDVDIIEFNQNSNITNEVIKKPNSYGIGKASLIIDKYDGNDIILLSSVFQNSPLVLISLEKSNIKTPKDLKNRKIMITNDAKEAAALKTLITSQGVSQDDLIIQEHTFKIEDLISGKTEVMASYLSNEPYILESKKIPYNIINPNDYNFNFYEGILFTSLNELLTNPTRVQNFNEASLKGWSYAFKNIEETAKLIYEKYNTQNKTLEALIYEGNVLKKLSKFDNGNLGEINPEKIDEIKRFYNFLGLNKNNNIFDTNSIILNKTEVIFNKEKLNYLENNHFTLLVEDNKIPFSFKLTNQFKGIEIDFWNLISEKLNKPFNIEETIDNKMFNIFSNTVKAKFIYSYEGNDKNNNYILSKPISQINLAIATKNDKNFINDLSILSNKKIAVLDKLNIKNLLEKDFPNIDFIEVNSVENGFYKLKNNEAYGFIDNIYSLTHYINKNHLSNIKINSTIDYSLNMYLQIEKKDYKFVDLINSAINRITKDEEKIILNNYQQILYHDRINYIQFLKYILPLILLLLIFVIFNIKLKKEIHRRKEVEAELLKLANKDSLTNIFNRRKIEEICEKELIRSKRYGTHFSIIFFDLNDFKIINDKLGHHIGDEVLTKVTQTINSNIRESDSFGRWGGDEFLIVLPQTNENQAKAMILTLEKNINDLTFDVNSELKISCSFGISEYEKGDTLDSLLKKADKSMYTTKALYKQELSKKT